MPIGSFQAPQHRMVDVLISYEQAKSIACLACVKVDTADPAERRRVVSAAKIKIAISHTFRRLTILAQAFGDADYHLTRFAASA